MVPPNFPGVPQANQCRKQSAAVAAGQCPELRLLSKRSIGDGDVYGIARDAVYMHVERRHTVYRNSDGDIRPAGFGRSRDL